MHARSFFCCWALCCFQLIIGAPPILRPSDIDTCWFSASLQFLFNIAPLTTALIADKEADQQKRVYYGKKGQTVDAYIDFLVAAKSGKQDDIDKTTKALYGLCVETKGKRGYPENNIKLL